MKKIITYIILYLILSVSTLSQINEFKLLPGDGAAGDWFGSSVSISGNYAIVGAPFNNDSTGAAYVFRLEGSNWIEEQKLVVSNGSKRNDWFGYPVSISGDYAVIGAPFSDSTAGAAYVFRREGTNWIEEQKLTPSDGIEDGLFGKSVSISGDYLIIGAPFNDSTAGAAYVFRQEGTNWIEEQKLSESNAGRWFGVAVSISGDYIIVGAAYLKGSAYVYKREGNNWLKEQKLNSSGADTLFNRFGFTVSITDQYAIVGSYFSVVNGIYPGAAYVFRREGANWTEEQKLVASDGGNGDYFGVSVSITGEYAVVGSLLSFANGIYPGAAYVFRREGTNWNEEQKLSPSDGATSDRFGFSVSVSGENAIVGAPLNDGNGNSSGSAYIYSGFVVGVENDVGEHPLSYSLGQNYPNPFNPFTIIRYSIQQSSNVVIKVYDVLGNEVATLVDKYKPAGSYEVEWNASNYPSGVYFYQLTTDNYIETKKMLLLK